MNYSQGDSILANRYTYGAGDPMANNDPTGNWPSCGWCKRVGNGIKNGVSAAWGGVKSAGTWLYRQSTAALSAAWRFGVDTFKGAMRGLQAGFNSLKSAYNKYIAPRVKQARDWVAARAAEAHRVAVQVRDKAKAAISYVAKKTPIGKLAKAALPVLAGLGKLAITAVTQPAKFTQAFHAVVQDTQAAAKQLYDQALAVGGAVMDGLQKAGDWVVDHKAEILGGIVSAVVGVGCGALIGASGVGLVACGALAGMAGSLVTDLVAGGKGWKEMAGNAFKNGILGAVLGPLSAVGGSAIAGGARGLLKGGLNAMLTGGREGARGAVTAMGGRQIGGVVGRALEKRAAGAAAGRDGAEALGGSCPVPVGNSFVPGTLVLMADGSTKPIEDVRVGDMVLATDPTTGKTEKREVTDLIVGYGEKELVELTIDTGDGADTITATIGHPFWAPDLGKWVDAGDLKPESMLQTGAGTYVKVSAVRRSTAQSQEVRNLTVDGLHTYYALAGATPVLVHNAGVPCRPGHIAEVTVFDSTGRARGGLADEAGPRTVYSGRQLPEELAQGKRKGAMASHTEARATREAGSPYPYWKAGDDPLLGRSPATPGDTYFLEGELAPCSWCARSMQEAAENTNTNWVYKWNEDGVDQFWVATPGAG